MKDTERSKNIKKSALVRRWEKFASSAPLEEFLFWMFLPMMASVGIIASLAIVFSGGEAFQLVSILLCPIFSGIMMILGAKTKKIRLAYNLFVLTIGCIIVPLNFLCFGGLHSGMPIYALAALLMCTFCYTTKYKIITVVCTIAVNFTVMHLSTIFPKIIFSTPSSQTDGFIFFSFAIVSIVMVAACAFYFEEHRKANERNQMLSRHLDSRIVPLLDGTIGDGKGQKLKIAIMYVDISDFTRLTESMDAETIASFLREFFSITDKHIHENEGIIDKYIGDCVMAYWLDEKDKNCVELACRAANQIMNEMIELSDAHYNTFKCELNCSAGISYGDVVMGEVGSENRKDFTVIGDCVNVASRIESLARPGTVLLSGSAAIKIAGLLSVEKLKTPLVLKGKTLPIEVYSLKSMNKPALDKVDAASETVNGYVLHICGCRGSYATAGRRYFEYGGETSCYVIKKDKHAIVIDCGSGLQRARELLSDCDKIDVLMTHMHYDHIIGLLDWSIFPADADLKFFGNFTEWGGENTLHEFLKPPFWPVDQSRGKIFSVEFNIPCSLSKGVNVTFYRADHPDSSAVFILNLEGKRLCVMADSESGHPIPRLELSTCDIMMYDGMFDEKEYFQHVGWGHSTWQSGVKLAKAVGIKRLIITHHHPYNSDEVLNRFEEEAKKMFAATDFAKAGDRFVL